MIGILYGVYELCCFNFVCAPTAPQILIVIIMLFYEFFICIFDKMAGIGSALSSAGTKIQVGAPISAFWATICELYDRYYGVSTAPTMDKFFARAVAVYRSCKYYTFWF